MWKTCLLCEHLYVLSASWALCQLYCASSIYFDLVVNPSELGYRSICSAVASGERFYKCWPNPSIHLFVCVQDQPCLNGGQCHITWNNFRCDCPISFSGRLCETRLWCVDSPCPDGVHCVNLKDGYECE